MWTSDVQEMHQNHIKGSGLEVKMCLYGGY